MKDNLSNASSRIPIKLFSSRVVKLLLKMDSTVLAAELGDGSHKILAIEQVKRDSVTSWILHTDMNVEIHEDIPITQECWADNQMQLIERVVTKYCFKYGYEELYRPDNSSSLSLLETAEIEPVEGFITVIKHYDDSSYILSSMDLNNEYSILQELGDTPGHEG